MILSSFEKVLEGEYNLEENFTGIVAFYYQIVEQC